MAMKRLITFTLLAATAQTTYARCNVPAQIDGRTFTNAVSQAYSRQNPNAGHIYRLEFDAETYTSHLLNTGEAFPGTYTYRKLAHNMGQITATESFGGQLSTYTLTLVCLSQHTGTFIYTQDSGAIAPDVRQNTGTYTLQDG
ncbi:MAG TPA: hypothetical protein VIM98_05865 [Dyella sp.]|uniref:hypothetical protein n=1 Tax=Dyella sp. TaxID=1869338 RepID=UPI002F92E61F